MRHTLKTFGISALFLSVLATVALGAIGDLLATVTLPGNPAVSVAGTFDGTYYMTTGASDNVIGVYQPPAGNGAAALVSTKAVLDAGNNPVIISALAWDPGREKLWGAYNDKVYLIDVGDPTVSGNALATFQFSPSVQAPGEAGPHPSGLPGLTLVDGLAYDGDDGSIWYSPDVHNSVYHFASDGTYLGKVTPKNAAGQVDGLVSGVAVGAGNTLYIGRDGQSEVRRIDKTTGNFISTFATTSDRVEDLTCDPVTYAPNEAILAKDAYNGLYEAFEVEPGTCPLPSEPGTESELIAGQNTAVGTVTVTNDDENVHVKYATEGDWVMTELHLHIADELDGIPQTKSGNPKVGRFEFNFEFDTPVTEFEISKSLGELAIADDDVAVAAHAVVYNTFTGIEETAWADTQGLPFPGNSWAMYFKHELAGLSPPGPN